jgi:2-polyprenyl-6-methoxyphenol hydroxylase-like FAD-dependent oxidoreductase
MQPTILVVGAGPVGLTMAAELSRYGMPLRIIEKAPQRTDKSKAIVLWSRTLELLDRAGCGGKFVDAGFKVKAANVIAGGKQIAHVRLDEVKTPHPYALMLPQSDTERLLDEHLNTFGVKVERQVELIQFTSAADKVSATLRHADGQEETIEVAWLIGCDGAHSAVRHGLNFTFEGDTLLSDWMLADVHLTGSIKNPYEVNTYWHADGVLVLFPISEGRFRMIADFGRTKGNEHRADPTLAEIQAVLDQRGPGGIHALDPIWLASFRINERKVKHYRAGRVFLAGDAAHVHSPAGGQGMNTGMQDACNLAWKLALVQSGDASAELLLESYSSERSAVGEQVLKDAGNLTKIAMVRGDVSQFLRNHVAALAFGLPPVRRAMASKMSELTIGYPTSPLSSGSHHGNAGPAPGERAPVDGTNPVGSGRLARFALFARADAQGTALLKKYSTLLEPDFRAPFAEDGIWLVRPDGYVAIVAKHQDWQQIDTYLSRLSKSVS